MSEVRIAKRKLIPDTAKKAPPIGELECKICFNSYNHLGSHIFHGHGMTAREYKRQFGLDLKMGLISVAIKTKKQIEFNKNSKKYLKNLIESGKKFRFKKGHTNNEHKYISEQTKQRANETINQVNASRTLTNCPVCNIASVAMTSHLYNAHNLKIADK